MTQFRRGLAELNIEILRVLQPGEEPHGTGEPHATGPVGKGALARGDQLR